jgi:hypothetical protein
MRKGSRPFEILIASTTLLVVMMLLAACGGPEPTAPVVVVVVTSPPTPEVVATDTQPPAPPSDTPTTAPPTDTTEPPLVTPPPPTETPIAATATIASTPTDTPTPDTPTSVPTKRPTNTPEASYPAPTLIAPLQQDAGSLRGQVTFKWSYPRPLGENEAFQVLAWKGSDAHYGVAELWTETEQTIDLDGVLPGRAGTGDYFWTVVVVEKSSGRILSPEPTPWVLTYLGPWDPCASCDCNSQCKDGNCAECCAECCGGCE